MTRTVQYSEKYNDDSYEYRWFTFFHCFCLLLTESACCYLSAFPSMFDCEQSHRLIFSLRPQFLFLQACYPPSGYCKALSQESASLRGRVASNWCSAIQGLGTLRSAQVIYFICPPVALNAIKICLQAGTAHSLVPTPSGNRSCHRAAAGNKYQVRQWELGATAASPLINRRL